MRLEKAIPIFPPVITLSPRFFKTNDKCSTILVFPLLPVTPIINGLESKIKETYSIESFVKINKDQISIVVSSNDHNYKKANDIIRLVQENYEERMYITVKFQ